MGIEVRLAEEADAGALCEVHVRSIREVCVRDYPDPAHLDRWCENKTPENYRAWIADPENRTFAGLLDGVVAGVGIVNVKDGWVQVLYLAPEALGHGLGKALLAELEREAVAHGHQVLGLNGTITARGFYESQGFRTLETTEHRGVPSFRMEKALR